YALSTVIDCARLPVISTERRQSAHFAECRAGADIGGLPKKRATRKVGTEAANVFTVRIRDSRLGIAYYLPQLVDLAPHHPTVWSSERAEVGLDSADIYQCASVLNVPKQKVDLRWCKHPSHDLRPALIIEGHRTTQIVVPLTAQVSNAVPDLGDRSADVSQSRRRKQRYPQIPRVSKRIHISSRERL